MIINNEMTRKSENYLFSKTASRRDNETQTHASRNPADRPRLTSAFNKNNNLLIHRDNRIFSCSVDYPRDTFEELAARRKRERGRLADRPALGKLRQPILNRRPRACYAITWLVQEMACFVEVKCHE